MLVVMRAAPDDRSLEDLQARYLDRVAPGHRTRRVRWSGGATQVIDIGAGPPLLLVHGGLGEAFQWGPLLAPLAERHRVIAVDRPGHGLADPFDYRRVDLLELGRTFIRDILDGESLQSAKICASSMGGLWATAFALDAPARVDRLVLVGSPAGIVKDMPIMLRLGTLPGLRALIRRMMRRPTPDAVRSFWAQLLVVHPDRVPEDFLALSAASQRRNAESWFSLIDRTMDIRGMRPDLLRGARFRDLTVPTTFVWGERDAWADAELGEAVIAGKPHMHLARIPDAGHVPWFDDPEATLSAIEATHVTISPAARTSRTPYR